jgi:hypothetical protein
MPFLASQVNGYCYGRRGARSRHCCSNCRRENRHLVLLPFFSLAIAGFSLIKCKVSAKRPIAKTFFYLPHRYEDTEMHSSIKDIAGLSSRVSRKHERKTDHNPLYSSLGFPLRIIGYFSFKDKTSPFVSPCPA